jgi:hypothetical protein
MTFIDPTPSGAPQPETQPGATPVPEMPPIDIPEEMPQPEPGGGNDNDSRPFDA